jgi:hypothetical protein
MSQIQPIDHINNCLDQLTTSGLLDLLWFF